MRLNISRIAGHCLIALALSASGAAHAVSSIEITVRELAVPGIKAERGRVTLALGQSGAPSATISASSVDLGATLGRFRNLRVQCPRPSLDAPRFGCPAAQIVVAGGPLSPMRLGASLEYRSDTGDMRARGALRDVADVLLRFDARTQGERWIVDASLSRAALASLARRFGPQLGLPADLTTEGFASVTLTARGRDDLESATIVARLEQINLTNEAGTIVGENVNLSIDGSVTPAAGRYAVALNLASAGGQALAGPVLLNFDAHPLSVTASGTWADSTLDVSALQLTQQKVSRVTGTARVSFREAPTVERARLAIEELTLPGAYVSFMQIALAATDFGQLSTSGRMTGLIEIDDNSVSRLQTRLYGLELEDPKRDFFMRGLSGEINWSPHAARDAPLSQLQWREAGAYGLSGGAARLLVQATGDDLVLSEPARLPVFDGAIAVRTFAVTDLGTEATALQFEGDIEPISMPQISKAFGWPELAGQLSGRIPRVEYRNKTLTFGGDLEARVFDGRIIGSNIRLQDPLGPWPRLFADVRASNLDLDLVTRAFSIGSITGRLEGHVLALELFNWSPVAFDAVLQTPPGYKGTRRISAKAVGELSNIGGGGGGVVGALQSGVFRMFDEYDYDRIGIRCKLSGEVCLMGGVQPAGIGYYILKGRGLPHIDIIGNAGRVNWRQLASQIGSQMRGEGKIRVE